jgi:hypothetical protein
VICVSTGETLRSGGWSRSHARGARGPSVDTQGGAVALERRETYITLLLDAGPASIIGSSG